MLALKRLRISKRELDAAFNVSGSYRLGYGYVRTICARD
jgi:hypothetical protein